MTPAAREEIERLEARRTRSEAGWTRLALKAMFALNAVLLPLLVLWGDPVMLAVQGSRSLQTIAAINIGVLVVWYGGLRRGRRRHDALVQTIMAMDRASC